MAEDLSAPLRGRKHRKTRATPRTLPALPLARLGLAILLVIAGIVIGRIVLVEDREGGRPTAEIQIGSGSEANPLAESLASRPLSGGIDGGATITVDPGEYSAGSFGTAAQPEARASISSGGGASPTRAGIDPALLEETEYGAIPRVSATGKSPFEAYSRPAPPGSGPAIALVVVGLGINEAGTLDVIDRLPADISLAFAPYGRSLDSVTESARNDGHEVLLEIPLEPFDYPASDPGPQTLLTGQPPRANLDKLFWLMARLEGYVGVVNNMGARFTASAEDFAPVMEELGLRGIGYLDDGTSNRSLSRQLAQSNDVPFGRAGAIVDENPGQDAIHSQLEALERRAVNEGSAIGIVSALPVSIRMVAEWADQLQDRGIRLVPVSALMRNEDP